MFVGVVVVVGMVVVVVVESVVVVVGGGGGVCDHVIHVQPKLSLNECRICKSQNVK